MLCVFHPGSECVLFHLKRLSRGQHEVVCFAIQSDSGRPLTDWSVNLLTFHVLADKAEFHFWFLLSPCLSLLSFTAFFALQDAFGEKCSPSLQHPWEAALVFVTTWGWGWGGPWLSPDSCGDTQKHHFSVVLPWPRWCDVLHRYRHMMWQAS